MNIDVFEYVVEVRLVDSQLSLSHATGYYKLVSLRKLAVVTKLAACSPQYMPPDPVPQLANQLLRRLLLSLIRRDVAALNYLLAVVLLEGLQLAQQASFDEIEERPELFEAVFHGRARQHHLIFSLKIERSLMRSSGTILYLLGLIQYHVLPIDALKYFDVDPNLVVRRHNYPLLFFDKTVHGPLPQHKLIPALGATLPRHPCLHL